jgi:putative sterol carrier protein
VPDPTAEFFAELATRQSEPLLGSTRATVRFDVVDGRNTDHWLLRIAGGALELTHGGGDADCVLSADKPAFDLLAGGRMNAMAAMLRGAIRLEGNPRLLVHIQRLFPAPVGMPEGAGDRAVGRRRS